MLKIEKLSKFYNATQALSDVDLEVSKGIIFGLLGPNGAGKTTLIRIINQIIDSDAGSVSINGELLAPKHIAQIGYLPEERGLYKKMSVWDQLIYFARLKGLSSVDAKSKINHWLDKLEISNWKQKKLKTFQKEWLKKSNLSPR